MQEIKSKIQKDAVNAIINNKGSGIISAATGSGKTKIAIDYIEYLKNKGRKISYGLYQLRNYVMKGLRKSSLSGVQIIQI